jgi:signal peptidase I
MATVSGESQPLDWLRVAFIGRRPKFTLWRIAFLVIGSFVVFKFILLPIRVEGASMLPTYRDRGVNFVNTLAYKWSKPKRGDVVTCELAGRSIMLMKRIVGLPGETLAFHRGRVLINGVVLDEPYVKLPCNWESPPFTLEADQYFVVGDNRSMPIEDHTMGAPHRSRIVGKLLL